MRKARELLSAAWGEYLSKPKVYIAIYAVPLLLSLLFILFDDTPGASLAVWEMVTISALTLVSVVANILMGIALILTAAGRSYTFVGSYKDSFKFFWKYLFVALLGGLATMVGLLLFIVPGIIIAVWFSQSYMVAILEGRGVVESLKTSKGYVSGKWWAVAWRIAFLALVMVLISGAAAAAFGLLAFIIPEYVASVILLAVNCVLVPLSIIYSYQLYVDLKGNGGTVSDQSMPEPVGSVI